MKRATLLLLLLSLALTPAFPAQNDDGKIHDLVMIRLADDVTVRGANLDVEVKDGVVTLRGVVREDRARDRATKVARKVKGVKSVVNDLQVKID
jgi:osmotically-inducible protein OsmY